MHYEVFLTYDRSVNFEEEKLGQQLHKVADKYGVCNIGDPKRSFTKPEKLFFQNAPDISFLFGENNLATGFVGDVIDLDEIMSATVVPYN